MKEKESMAEQENVVVEALKTIGLSALLAFGIRTFVAEARFIPSGSMEPTLQIDDRLIIDKVSYRFEAPQRGDIVVFNPTDELRRQDFKDAFIKRIIGLPGDQVEMRNGQVYVNGQAIPEAYIQVGDVAIPEDIKDKLNRNWTPNKLELPARIPPGSYLVFGDNRDNSYDSRFWGYVPRDKIIGRAVVRFWPPRRVGGIQEPSYPSGLEPAEPSGELQPQP
ncbi:MAG: signal peptidase I [Synechococcales cyanobacterium RM1_1_8]|nr:signal peptidase I [Synechococcales cyanobacterium RM1_1_8]